MFLLSNLEVKNLIFCIKAMQNSYLVSSPSMATRIRRKSTHVKKGDVFFFFLLLKLQRRIIYELISLGFFEFLEAGSVEFRAPIDI